MAVQNEQTRWADPSWLVEVTTWIHATLTEHSLALAGPLEPPQIRPWSAMVRVPTTAGLCYFKASAVAFAHEPLLTQALAHWYPDDIVPLVATEPNRHWLLMYDSSPTLRSRLQTDLTLDPWQQIWPRYAEMQRALSHRESELLALGVPDRRLTQLPTLYATLLAERDALRIEQPERLTAAEYEQLTALIPRFGDLCVQLAAYGLPATLHHDDFHDANIFAHEGRYRITDWAESCVTHPFFTLVVGLRSIAYRFDLADDDPALDQLRTLYLTAWQEYGTLPVLQTACQLAECLGTICRALTWHHAVMDLPEPLKTEYGEAVPRWLQQFLAAHAALT